MNRLKMLREERGLTQADLAEVIGVKTPQCIGTYELGKRDIATPVSYTHLTLPTNCT